MNASGTVTCQRGVAEVSVVSLLCVFAFTNNLPHLFRGV